MTHICVMCGKDKETPGWSVCDACHEKGRLALLERDRPKTAAELLKLHDEILRQKAAQIPAYERD
jgi:hypothetical protein